MKEVNRGTVRAISIKTGKFIYGSPCCIPGRGRDSIIVNTGTHDAPVFELESVFPTTIGMYATTDSLGNPVFEHDIVWIRYCLNPYGFFGSLYRELDHGVIKWVDTFEQLCVCFGSDHSCRMINIGQYAEFEVVGNLFESPVLGRWALNHTPICQGRDGRLIYDGDVIRQSPEDPGCLVLWNSQRMEYVAITTTGERFPVNTIADRYYSVGCHVPGKRELWKPDKNERISWNMEPDEENEE